MVIPFVKMHGLGNDFVVFDATHHAVELSRDQMRRIADRRFGVGCDQILMVLPPKRKGVDFTYRIFNADGGEVEQCGNGARCFARFVRDRGLTDKDDIAFETLAGVITAHIQPDGQVSINMGVPVFDPAALPFQADAPALQYDLELEGKSVPISAVSMGNPHAVQLVKDIDMAPVNTQGPLIMNHVRFPKRVNAVYMQVLTPDNIRVRVYERGVGETLACGTGACAAVVVGRQRGLLDAKVKVQLPGGKLSISWQGEGQPVELTGPATTVFEGMIELERL